MLACTRVLRATSALRARGVAATLQVSRAASTAPTILDPNLFQQAVDAHLQNKDSFKNKPLDSVEISCVEGRPFFHVDGEDVGFTLVHLTPFALTGMCHFGPKGNFGIQRRFPSGVVVVDKLVDAQQELALSDIDPVASDQQNELMADYVKWLHGIQSKLVDHIIDNLDSYPSLKSKYGFLMRDNDTSMLRDGLLSCTSKISNTWQGPEGNTVEFVSFKQPVYVKRRQDTPPRIFTEADREVQETHARAHVRVFDETGAEIPVDKAIIRRGDVISCTATVTPTVYNVAGNVGITIRKRVRNITRIFERQDGPSTPRSPYGKLME